MKDFDRIKKGLAAFVRAVTARIDFLALYPCKIVKQNSDGTLELQPDDPRLPGMSSVPIRLGIPGAKVTVVANSRLLLGFENGDAAKPVATLWDASTVTKLELVAGEVDLGEASPAEFVALANKVLTELNAIRTAFDAHTHPVPGITPGGGATTASVPTVPMGSASSVAATKTKAA